MRPTRFFAARTRSAIPNAARTACSTGLSASVPTNDSRRASTTMTTSPERSPSYSFVKSRSRRADAFQLIRRTWSPATYSRRPQNSVPGPIRREGTCPNHGRVRRGCSCARRRSSIAGATTSGERRSRATSWAPKASGSNDRTRTGPRTKSPFTCERTVYARRSVPAFSKDTTAWFVPRITASSRGRMSAISTRSRDDPSFRMRSSTSTSRPVSVRSRDSERTATMRGLGGGARDPRARTITGGKARSTTCQFRTARPRRRNPIEAAARPLDSGVRMSRHLRHGHLGQDIREHGRRPDPADPGIRFQDEPVGQRGPGDGFHIVRGHEVPARDRGPRPRDLQEGERPTRARADLDLAVSPRRHDDVDHVAFHGGIDVDVFDRSLQSPHLVRLRHGFDRRVVRTPFSSTFEDLHFLFPRGIADVDPEEEPVHLGLGEWIGAFVLDRVLRRNTEERSVEMERLHFVGGLLLLHRLEQGGLRLRRRAIDLVRQEQMGEDRAAAEDEVARLAIGHVRTGDVRGKEVRGELDPAERESEARGKGLRDQRLREAGHVLDQEVSVPEDRPEHPLEDGPLADDHALHGIEERCAHIGHGGEVHRQASMGAKTSRNFRVNPPRSRARTTQAYRPPRSPAPM